MRVLWVVVAIAAVSSCQCLEPVEECRPITSCVPSGRECGPMSDGCGGTVNCGSCVRPNVCSAAGRCGPVCRPKTCSNLGAMCGSVSDGCGGTLSCGTCSRTLTCQNNQCVGACSTMPTCAQLGVECGPVADGCGGQLNCGSCASGFRCSNFQCVPGCPPTSCSEQGAECGVVSDACGSQLDCGTCGLGRSCVNNQCVLQCTPRTCFQQSAQCGTISDGCGAQLNCGSCGGGLSCIGNQCLAACTPRTCADQSLSCGTANDGCGAQLNCGTCSSNESCLGGRCVCAGAGCRPASGDWRTLGGDLGHTGFNALEQGRPPLSLRWSAFGTGVEPVVVEGDRVYAVTSRLLTALDAADGGVRWTQPFPTATYTGQPAVFDGQVYVAHCNHANDTKLWAFNGQTGSTTWSVAMTAQWERYWAPIRVGNGIYTNGGYFGGLYGFDAMSGANLFFNSMLEQYDEWSPASDGNLIYTFVAGVLRAHQPQTGVMQWQMNVTWNWSGWSMATSPVISNGMAYVIAPPNLHAIELSTRTVRWTASGLNFTGTPAVANGVVYAVSAGNVRAHDAATGAFLWTFAGDGALEYPPVLTQTHLYAASRGQVFAVDLTTHASVWSATGGGWLSLANGSLYVAGPSIGLRAYSLTP